MASTRAPVRTSAPAPAAARRQAQHVRHRIGHRLARHLEDAVATQLDLHAVAPRALAPARPPCPRRLRRAAPAGLRSAGPASPGPREPRRAAPPSAGSAASRASPGGESKPVWRMPELVPLAPSASSVLRLDQHARDPAPGKRVRHRRAHHAAADHGHRGGGTGSSSHRRVLPHCPLTADAPWIVWRLKGATSEPYVPPGRESEMTLDELKTAVSDGSVDTVLLAIADMEGRLQGKRLTASFFLDQVAEHGAEGCNYLLAVDVDMDTVARLRDVELGPGLRRLRDEARLRHAAADSLARGHGAADGRPEVGGRQRRGGISATDPAAPARAPGRARLDRDRGHRARVHGVQRHLRGRLAQGLPRPRAGQPLQRRLLAARHRSHRAADPPHPQLDGRRRAWSVENSKGECNFGQHEINFRYADALRTADEHAIYKNGAKEIAAQEGKAITFMAKFNEREGNSCHIHCSLAGEGGNTCSPTTSSSFDRFVAGQLACLRELTLFFAPHINSYKRFAVGSFAPTAVAWGARQPHLLHARGGPRAGGAGGEPAAGRRREPLPGARRDDRRGPARDRQRAAARGRRSRATPTSPTSRACRTRWRPRATCSPGPPSCARRSGRRWSTTTSTEHRIELEAYQAAVTDWERYRGFERL